MSDPQVLLVLRAIQGLQAHKVFKVLQEQQVLWEQQDQSERLDLQECKE